MEETKNLFEDLELVEGEELTDEAMAEMSNGLEEGE